MKISSLCLVLLVFQHSILFPCPEESIEEETPPAFEDYEVDPFLPVGANQANSTSLIPEDFSNSPFNLLIFGGGYSPSGNQFSLESNVKYFIRVRSALGQLKHASRSRRTKNLSRRKWAAGKRGIGLPDQLHVACMDSFVSTLHGAPVVPCE